MRRTSTIGLVLFALFISTAALAAVPQTLHYSGKLDTGEDAFTGTVDVTFALYEDASAATSFWSETQAVEVTNGRFHAQLGSKTTLTPADVDVAALHLGVTVGTLETDDEMERVAIASVPYALRAVEAGNATTVGGQAASSFADSSHTHPLADLEHPNCSAGQVLTSDGAAWICGTEPVLIEADPKVASATTDAVPRWNGTQLVDSVLTVSSGGRVVSGVGDGANADIGSPGAGTRLAWYPSKVAFRVGSVTGDRWDNINVGDYSTAMGYNTRASGEHSTAMGYTTTASEIYSTALGYGTTASGSESTAMGYLTTASGPESTAMGHETEASGVYSTAMGYESKASGQGSTAMGTYTIADGSWSTALGYTTRASGYYSTAMGKSTTASGLYSTAMGNATVASGINSFAMGLDTKAQAPYSMAMGTNINVGTTADHSIAIGLAANALVPEITQPNTLAVMGGKVGVGTVSPSVELEVDGQLKISNTGSGGIGQGLIVDNDAGGAIHHHHNGIPRWSLGFDTNINTLGESFTGFYVYSRLGDDKYLIHENDADLSLLPGNVGNVGIGTVSPSAKLEVNGTVKATAFQGDGSGLTNVVLTETDPKVVSAITNVVPRWDGTQLVDSVLSVTSAGSVVSGGGYNANADIGSPGQGTRLAWYPQRAAFRAGFASGAQWDNADVGAYTMAVGYGTTASGFTSVAMGNQTIATGTHSTAMGVSSVASGNSSTAMGSATTASGSYSTAMGSGAIASGESSTAMGAGTTASGDVSTAMGSGTTASGHSSTAMGSATTASGDYSTAMGSDIKVGVSANHSFGIGLGGVTTTPEITLPNTMAITGGNVGIGTVSPTDKLAVKGSLKVEGTPSLLKLSVNGGNAAGTENAAIEHRNDYFGPEVLAKLSFTNTPGVYEHGAADIVFSTRPDQPGTLTERMRIANSGNVGIGLTNPSEALEVKGSVKADSIKFPDGTTQTTAAAGGATGSVLYLRHYVQPGACPNDWSEAGINFEYAGDGSVYNYVRTCYRDDATCFVLYLRHYVQPGACPNDWSQAGINFVYAGDGSVYNYVRTCYRCP